MKCQRDENGIDIAELFTRLQMTTLCFTNKINLCLISYFFSNVIKSSNGYLETLRMRVDNEE